MPTYEYECKKCAAVDEIKQRITEDAISVCPHCASEEYVRLIGGGSFILKGSGWYADGYSSGSAGGTEPAKPAKPAESTTSTESSTGSGSPSHSCGSSCGCG